MHVLDLIPEQDFVSSKEFAKWVLLAENMEPNPHSSYFNSLEKAFVHFMDGEVVHTNLLK